MKPFPFAFLHFLQGAAAPAGTPFLDSLALTLNCRPGDVVVSGTTVADTVKWTSRPSAGSSGNNSLYKLDNSAAVHLSTSLVNGKSTLVVPTGGSAPDLQVTPYDAAFTTQRNADVILGAAGVDSTPTFSVVMLARFIGGEDFGGCNIASVGFADGQWAMRVVNDTGSTGRVSNYLWFGSSIASAIPDLRTGGAWQVLFVQKTGAAAPIAQVNDDAATVGSGTTGLLGGLTSNPLVVGPRTIFSGGRSMEIGGLWTTNLYLSSSDRTAIVAELRTFTGQALA